MVQINVPVNKTNCPVSACGNCRGIGCNNQPQEETDFEEEEFQGIPDLSENHNLLERLFDI